MQAPAGSPWVAVQQAALAAPRAVEAQGLRHVDFRWGDAG